MSQDNPADVLRKIEVNEFSNRVALDMGQRIIELAKSRNQHIAV